jgi:hypothetical protein
MLKRTWMWSAIALLLVSASSQAAEKSGKYISVFYGYAKSSSSTSIADGVSGTAMGGAIGLGVGPSSAIEFMGRKTQFKANSTTTDLSSLGLGTLTTGTEMSVLLLSVGLRRFFFKILNIHLGAGYAMADPKFSISGTGQLAAASASIAKSSGLGIYGGAGIQIPVSIFDLTGDYTYNRFSSDVTSTEMTGGLRIRF